MSYHIPNPALLAVFAEVWNEYTAFIESNPQDPRIIHFIVDVEYQFKLLFPNGHAGSFESTRRRLLLHPKSLPSSRSALGLAFLNAGLWPVQNYFAK